MLATEAIVAGRAVLTAHLEPGERIDFATAGALRRRTGLVRKLLGFFGAAAGPETVLVLTTTRLVALHPGATPTSTVWLDLQLDRRRLRAGAVMPRGNALVVPLDTGLGPVSAVFSSERAADAADLARRLTDPGR